MTGRYSAIARTTGLSTVQIVHIWTVESGKLATFQQYTDTLAVALATGAATPGRGSQPAGVFPMTVAIPKL